MSKDIERSKVVDRQLVELRARLDHVIQRLARVEARQARGLRAWAWDSVQFLTPKEAAIKLRVLPETIRRWVRTGKIPGIRIQITRHHVVYRVPAWWVAAGAGEQAGLSGGASVSRA